MFFTLTLLYLLPAVTLETSGGGLSQREEDVTHDGGAANAGGGDDVEDAVDVLTEVFLEGGGGFREVIKYYKRTH